MALTFDVSEVLNHANITTAPYTFGGLEQWHPVTSALVTLSLSCGFDRITEENVETVWKRVSRYQAAFGALLQGPRGDVFMTKVDVLVHIGLRTNAQQLSDKDFNENLLNLLDSEAESTTKGASAMERLGWKGVVGADSVGIVK